jgi:hypothetical protein
MSDFSEFLSDRAERNRAWWETVSFAELLSFTDSYYGPDDPEDAFEPVGPYTAEDLAFLADARAREGEPTWTSDDPNNSL